MNSAYVVLGAFPNDQSSQACSWCGFYIRCARSAPYLASIRYDNYAFACESLASSLRDDQRVPCKIITHRVLLRHVPFVAYSPQVARGTRSPRSFSTILVCAAHVTLLLIFSSLCDLFVPRAFPCLLFPPSSVLFFHLIDSLDTLRRLLFVSRSSCPSFACPL